MNKFVPTTFVITIPVGNLEEKCTPLTQKDPKRFGYQKLKLIFLLQECSTTSKTNYKMLFKAYI